jgi:hypothetical protein
MCGGGGVHMSNCARWTFFVKITPQGNHIIKRWMAYKLVYIVAHIKGANAAPQSASVSTPLLLQKRIFLYADGNGRNYLKRPM